MKERMDISVGREHARFLGAVFVGTVTAQASVVVDSAIGGALLGENVVSAVNLVLPVEEVFYGLSLLLGMGACTAASFAFGKGLVDDVRRLFTAAMVSAAAVFVVLGIGLYVFREQVLDMLCGESYLREYAMGYLISVMLRFVVGNLVGIVIQFVAMTGKPQLAMYSSIVYCAGNALFDWLLVGVMGCGIEWLGYSSVISSFVALGVVLPYWVRFMQTGDVRPCVSTGGGKKSNITYIMGDAQQCVSTRYSFGQMMRDVRTNVHYGKGLITGEISYIIFSFAMNGLVLRYMGEEGLYCWSVVVMIFLVCDFASAASQETCLSLGGKYTGAGKSDYSTLIFRRSMIFTICWVVLCLVLVVVLPEEVLPLFGATTGYEGLVPVILMTLPVTIGLNLVNLYIVRLIIKNRVELFTILVAVLYLSVPMFYYIYNVFDYGWWGVLALVPVQVGIVMVVRKSKKKQ